MPSITCETSALLLVDFQSRLMPVIDGAAAVLDNARRLVDAAQLLGVPLLFTEQNAKSLGPTVPELHTGAADTAHKMAFIWRMVSGSCAAWSASTALVFSISATDAGRGFQPAIKPRGRA